MKRMLGFGLVLLFVIPGLRLSLVSAAQDDAVQTLKSLLPREVQGWRAEARDQIYDPETIFDYIDGAGEVYRSYNFNRLLSRRYQKEGSPDLIVDLFDMGSPADAFGVLTHDLDGEDVTIGQGGNYKGGLLSFWKDRFFVSIFAEKETDRTKQALFALGKSIAADIPREGAKPSLLVLLPAGFTDSKSVHYFHNYVILNYHFFVSQDNVLNLDQTTEAALAKSGPRGTNGVLLLVKYPDAKRAADAYESFVKAYMPDAKVPGLVRTEDNKWTAARAWRDLVAVIFGASSAEAAQEILAELEKKTGTRASPRNLDR
jgi:hypothetical protein